MKESKLSRTIILGFYTMLLIAGVTFYLLWSMMYDAWTDIGVYSLSAITIAFGIVGILLYSIKPLEESE